MGKLYHLYIKRKPGITLKQVEAKLDQALDWFKYSPGHYLVYTAKRTNGWYQILESCFSPGGNLFIISVDPNVIRGWMPKSLWTWIKDVRSRMEQKQSHLFVADVLTPFGPPGEHPGPWGRIIVDVPVRGGQEADSVEAEARLVVFNAGSAKWPKVIDPTRLNEIVLIPISLDVTALGKPDYEFPGYGSRAWIVTPEMEREHQIANSKK